MASYVIELKLNKRSDITVGALGSFLFTPGRYLYVGSAKKSWDSRIARHLAAEKKLRWHADYLTSHPETEPVRAWISQRDQECETAQALLKLDGVTPGVPRMGASDCHCPAHCLKSVQVKQIRLTLKAMGYVSWHPPHAF
ncbi:GIY-YIG nuclease family protein [Magnetococcus sp. PR-3]|uniref:GIY-YIG nuclease family protein n=1 Tax=Magnetococcus sp. PR-3 TaxID=3120355 RepID=UPI002FCE072A